MNRDSFAAFYERLGHRVVATRTSLWYDARSALYMSLPHAPLIEPTRDELDQLFARSRCWGVRFPTPSDGVGRPSYAMVLDDRAYDLPALSANTRSKVRRGLKQWTVERVEPKFLRLHGIQANTDTLTRLRVQKDPYDWTRYWDAVEATPDVEVWAAVDGVEIGAYIVVAIVDDVAEILTARSLDAGLRRYPNNALVYTAAQDLVRRPAIAQIFFGLESLDQADGVEQFKTSLGFRRLPMRQRIVFPAVLDRIVRHRLVGSVVQNVTRLRPGLELARKLEGLLIFHGSLVDAREKPKETAWIS